MTDPRADQQADRQADHRADPAPPARRPDASMTLLLEVMQRPLDPGYAEVHARRTAASHGSAGGVARPGRSTQVAVAIGAVAAGLALATAVVPLRAPGDEVSPAVALSAEITDRGEQADATVARIESLRAEIDAVQTEALTDDTGEVALLDRLQVASGAVPVTGPAVLLTLDNASTAGDPVAGDARDDEGAEDGRVIDVDLQIVVNGLWAAGAEAVAVDDVRLTSLAAIRNAGQAILVDQQPLQPPYEVVAIGDAAAMRTRFADSAAGRYLAGLQQNYGVRASVQGVDEARVPASGLLRLRYAAPAPAVGDGDGDGESSPDSTGTTDGAGTDAPGQDGGGR